MHMQTPFSTGSTYANAHPAVNWAAHLADDMQSCAAWLSGDVYARVFDIELCEGLKEDLATLQADGFDVSLLEALASEPEPAANIGDIGEAIADLFLIERVGAQMSPNRRRDLRSVNGSLPGADIVGYVPAEGGYEFLFGEVKASSQLKYPPGVMASTGDGMPAQLHRLASTILAKKRLIMYLRSRIKSAKDKEVYDSALRSFAEGRFALAGVLIRDTSPDEKDVSGPAERLSAKLLPLGRTVNLYVLHVSVPTSAWSSHCSQPQ